MKNINAPGLFDDHFLLETLSKLGDPLQKLSKYINWGIFESPINEAFKDEDRPAWLTPVRQACLAYASQTGIYQKEAVPRLTD